MDKLCRNCQEYDNECWYCWYHNCHVEPEETCEKFKKIVEVKGDEN